MLEIVTIIIQGLMLKNRSDQECGNKLTAINKFRELTGVGLYDGKLAVESLISTIAPLQWDILYEEKRKQLEKEQKDEARRQRVNSAWYMIEDIQRGCGEYWTMSHEDKMVAIQRLIAETLAN